MDGLISVLSSEHDDRWYTLCHPSPPAVPMYFTTHPALLLLLFLLLAPVSTKGQTHTYNPHCCHADGFKLPTAQSSAGRPLSADSGPTFTQRNNHADALTQSWTITVLHSVLVSGPITALAAASPQRKVTIFGRRTSGPCGGRKEGPQGRKGSVTPCVVWTWDHTISPLHAVQIQEHRTSHIHSSSLRCPAFCGRV